MTNFTRQAGMRRDEILAGEVTEGMTVVIGGFKKNNWAPQLLDVASVKNSFPSTVFTDDKGKRIYRWNDNWVQVLGFREPV